MDSFSAGNNPEKSYDRRTFIGQMLAGTGGVMLWGCMGDKDKSLPNIVLIISDDQGWGDYGFMGHPAIETPNLDKLARTGCVFTRGYVNSPLCGPSLASIITGLHPHQHKKTSNDPPSTTGMDANTRGWSEERRQLREQVIAQFKAHPTIPGKLKNRDYSSLQTGKWWMGHYSNGEFTDGMTHGDMDRGGRHGDEGLKIGRETMEPIYRFVNDPENHPFFLWYAPFLPHRPHNPPERLLEKYREKMDSIHIARYWANCEWFDETCGELLDYLDEKGVADNTLVLYICDNGWIQRPDNSGYAERSKRTSYEGGIRTPVMIRWPGHITPRMDETTLVNSIDLAPTILRACGCEPTPDMQGISLLDREALEKRDAVFGATYTHDAVDIEKPLASLKYTYVIEGEWKLILPSGRNDTGTTPELYHVTADPEEKKDLADANPEKTTRLIQRIREWWKEAVPEDVS